MRERVAADLAANVKRLREGLGMSQARLASASGVPRPTIANLETGSANPTLQVMLKIAAALRVGVEDLIGASRDAPRLFEPDDVPTEQHGEVTIRTLLPDDIPGMQIQRLELPPGAAYRAAERVRGTREYLACETGQLELSSDGETFRLREGALLAVRADRPREYACRARKATVAYSVVVLAPTGV